MIPHVQCMYQPKTHVVTHITGIQVANNMDIYMYTEHTHRAQSTDIGKQWHMNIPQTTHTNNPYSSGVTRGGGGGGGVHVGSFAPNPCTCAPILCMTLCSFVL